MTNSIRFYWNGIRLNGEKSLNKCWYSLDNNRDHLPSVSIYADGCRLPRDLFEVKNETDIYTDYFEEDSAYLTPDHPLYKYARYAAVKAEIRGLKRSISSLEKNLESHPYYMNRRDYYEKELADRRERLAKFEDEKDPGQPTAEDLEKIAQNRMEAENARKAAELEAQQKAREEMLRKRNEGRAYIESVSADHPIREGEPVVTINWSENPAFYSWEDDELKLSVAAAEIILKHFDEEVHAEYRGYDKTKFTINFINDDGEPDSYEGRYDLGDNDGGMIEHIRSFGRYYLENGHFGNGNVSDEDREQGEAIMNFADMLEGYTAGGRITNVVLAPWVEHAIREKWEESQRELDLVMYLVSKMTDDDLEAIVKQIDPEDDEQEPVARFFIQQLGLRDLKNAVRVYEEWKRGV